MILTPRDTSTGWVLEQMILPSLTRAGYTYETQVDIGERVGRGRHKVDVLAQRDGRRILISLKWQQSSGTAEQKVPFEVICLTEAIQNGCYDKAVLVLGGDGWKLRDYFVSGSLRKYLRFPNEVEITSLESFIASVNHGLI
jgi:hypothetical protein